MWAEAGGALDESGLVFSGGNGSRRHPLDGQPWTRLWWSPSGDSVTQWMPAARTAFANNPSAMDDRFDHDYTIWLANQPPPSAPTEPGGNGA